MRLCCWWVLGLLGTLGLPGPLGPAGTTEAGRLGWRALPSASWLWGPYGLRSTYLHESRGAAGSRGGALLECLARLAIAIALDPLPRLQDGMHAQELNGLWERKTIVCSSGLFEPNNYTQWRAW